MPRTTGWIGVSTISTAKPNSLRRATANSRAVATPDAKVGYAMTHPVDFGKTSPLGFFVVEQDGASVYLQFGFGSDSEITSDSVADPTNLVLDMTGRDFVQDKSFDPSKNTKS